MRKAFAGLTPIAPQPRQRVIHCGVRAVDHQAARQIIVRAIADAAAYVSVGDRAKLVAASRRRQSRQRLFEVGVAGFE
jgi:hypothetical protein